MGPIDINGWEFIVLAVLAVFVLGPERLPDRDPVVARPVLSTAVAGQSLSTDPEPPRPTAAEVDPARPTPWDAEAT